MTILPRALRGPAMLAWASMSMCAVVATAGAGLRAESSEKKVSYNREVQPLLSYYCFHCHGPDAGSRKAGLRLDLRDEALRPNQEGRAALVPGEPGRSLLLDRLVHGDPEERMPPPESKKYPTAAEIGVLERWIAEGGEYEAHWAFSPVAPAATPEVKDKSWSRHPLDAYVLAEIEKHGLAPSPPADAATLLRRLHLDLTGLLPTPEEAEAFQASHAENPDLAVDTKVRELLETPQHAERWARHWLDQARYADSNGYTIDADRVMWPYRDWVIRAQADGMPFDRFTIEQIAGDLLPNPTRAQLVATGFHRNTLINQEGGTDPEQFRNEAVADRVSTTGAVWLGLTLGCAQCHDHKFDPISQRDFFSFFAFFNSGEDVNNVGPTAEVHEGELFLAGTDSPERAALRDAETRLAAVEKGRPGRQTAWEALERAKAAPEDVPATEWLVVRPEEHLAEAARLEPLPDGSLLAGPGAEREVYRVSWTSPTPVEGLRLRLLTHESLPKQGPGLAGNGNLVISAVELTADGAPVALAAVHADHAQPGFPAGGLLDGDARTGWAINVGPDSAAKMNADHWAVFALARPLPAGKRLELTLRHEVNARYNTGRFALDVSAAPPALKGDPARLALLDTPPAKRSREQVKQLETEFAAVDVELKQARATVDQALRAAGLGPKTGTLVMRDLKAPRPTYIHTRGDFLREDKAQGELIPAAPEVLPALAGAVERPTRLDLAKWLVSRENPLTARVTVNRVWMRYFGQGLVETENDFGTQGSYPTHPALLDWLAGWFMDRGWSLRELHHLITTSAAYRQASHTRDDLASLDPRNLLLARQSRLRCDAEIVRDVGLSASGLLAPQVGGPPVRPPQPDGVYAFTQNNKGWVADTGANRYRRTLYTRFYRSAPHPMLSTFDAPDFQSVCTRRPRSNTPLQSLTMANDAGFFEIAQGLAERLMREVPGTDSVANRKRITRAFRLCYARPPTEAERETVAAYQEKQARRFGGDASEAATVAPGGTPAGFPVAEAAAWTAVARVLMNTDEFVTRE